MTDRDPWSDDRLAAAFAARAAASPSAAPPGALAATIEELRTADAQPTSRWARWRWPAATVGALAIGVVVIGAFTLGPRLLGRVGDAGAVSFVPGPTGDVRTLDAGEFTFDYPADWVGLDSSASFSDGSSIAVLGTGLPPNDCGTEPIDIDCVRALPLGEGEVRVLVGTGDFRGGTVHDRPNLELGTTTRTVIDGEPAIVEELLPDPADPLGADMTTHLFIARPVGPSHVVTIDVLARDGAAGGSTSAVAEAGGALDQIMTTFRFSDDAPTQASANAESAVPQASMGLDDTDPWSSPALRDGKLAVVGVDGVPGGLRCGNFGFPVEGLAAPTGAEERVGPEFDALRSAIADPAFADAFGGMVGWQEAGRTADRVVFLGTKPPNGDERHRVVLPVDRDGSGWHFSRTGGDCQPSAVLPVGYGTATWVLDPAFPLPDAASRTLHLLVTETDCASGAPAGDRLTPAYVVSDPYRIEISIGVQTRAGSQECQGNPPTAVMVDLEEPVGERPLIDPFAPPPDGSAG